MIYKNVTEAVFLRRPNRFIAEVLVDGKAEIVHVKNTGRCRELLLPGTAVYLSKGDNPNRKTAYDLIAVQKVRPGDTLLINMDSQVPNTAAAEWLPQSGLFAPDAHIRREVTHADSRFDFCITENEKISFLEVKGCTLETDGLALFPDAPTERGVKHIEGLIRCVQEGYGAYLLFVLQMKGMHAFSPNDAMHPAFGDALRRASAAGVRILAMDCVITPNSIQIDQPVPIKL